MTLADRVFCCVKFVAILFFLLVIYYFLSSTDKSINTDGLRAVNTLKFLVVVSRHGNRRSLYTIPNDPYPLNDTEHWSYELGELTTLGRVQMYNLGVKIRSLYNKFIKPQYSSKDFYAASTPIDRTLISAEAFLAGLYPPTGFQVWSEKILWQPIPVYCNSSDKSVFLESCPRYLQERAITEANYGKENAAMLSLILDYLSQNAGVNLTVPFDLLKVWDILISEDNEGYALPDWIKKVYPYPMEDLIKKLYISYLAITDSLIRLGLGPFYQEIIGIMQSKVNGSLNPDRQIYYYSGHDTTLIPLQAGLGIPELSIINPVKCGSAMIYELHQCHDTKRYTLQVLYIDGSSADLDPVPLSIPDCKHPCDFNQFIIITKRFINVNYKEECQLSE